MSYSRILSLSNTQHTRSASVVVCGSDTEKIDFVINVSTNKLLVAVSQIHSLLFLSFHPLS